jgi:hypothetical protein
MLTPRFTKLGFRVFEQFNMPPKKFVFSVVTLVGIMAIVSACSYSEKSERFAPSSEVERNCVQDFKHQIGQNRMATWEKLQPLLTNRLASVSKNQPDLKAFFEQWLGLSEQDALKRSESAVVWALSPQPNTGDVIAYRLSGETNFFEDLIIDFRNPNKIRIGIASTYAPPAKTGPEDQISEKEKQIAAELDATEINLGGGSQDGSAKPGFWVQLEDSKASEENVRKAAQLTTLVSLRLAGRSVTDACLAPLKGHRYLASLELDSTSISNAGLTNLAGLTALKWLTFKGGTITESQVNGLHSSLPKCEIEFEK